MEKKILFRADGNKETGLGHLYRLFALVEVYKKLFQFVFVTQESSTNTIFPKDYPIFFIPEKTSILDEPKWLLQNFNPIEYLIISDGYQFKSNYQKQIKDFGYSLIYVDDLVEGEMYADIIINHAANLDVSKYQVQPNTKLALGTDYAILRPSFIKTANIKRHITRISNAFVCFGGADTFNLSYKVTTALLELNEIKQIHVVLGAAYNHTNLEELAAQNLKINLYRNLSEFELYDLMMICNLAVAPSSTITYELCTVKMPILSGYFVENQVGLYNALLNKGAIEGVGDFTKLSTENFKNKIKKLITQRQYNQYVIEQQKLFDGQSSNRFIKLLNDLLISFRKATVDDLIMVYNWSNDPLVRKNSYNSEGIDLFNHKKWFNQKIVDNNTLFLIALFDNEPAGIVRYEIKEKHSVIGILIADKFRGKKLASSFLSESAKYYFELNSLPILANIKEENKPSIKAFEKAGYGFFKKEIVKETPSYIYKLEKV